MAKVKFLKWQAPATFYEILEIKKKEGKKIMKRKPNYNSIKRTEGGHIFNNQFIKAFEKRDSATFGMRLQNSSKYRSYKIKMKRRAKRK